MKKRILVGVMAIALIAGLVGAFTYAYFSDPEQATGTFSAGTIDIEVDGENPWAGSFPMEDLKPSEPALIEFTIHNVGTNPVVVWKHIGDIVPSGGDHPESEKACDLDDKINDIHNWINYDLFVDGEPIFVLGDDFSVGDIASMWVPICVLDPLDECFVEQSYHLFPETSNCYQGDSMTFAIDLYAEQRLGNGPGQLSYKLFLDDKTGDPDWYFMVDDTWGILTWDGTPTGDLYAQGLQASTEYSLITYPDPWPGIGLQVIATGTSAGDGTLSLSAFGMPSGYSGKIWLVLSSDVGADRMTAWNPAAYLYESNKVVIP